MDTHRLVTTMFKSNDITEYELQRSLGASSNVRTNLYNLALASVLLDPIPWAYRASLFNQSQSHDFTYNDQAAVRQEYQFFSRPAVRCADIENDNRKSDNNKNRPTTATAGTKSNQSKRSIAGAKLDQVKKPVALYQRGEVKLLDGYEPHPFDVICRKDRECVCHSGNFHFLRLVEMRVARYAAVQTRKEKTLIIREIINAVRSSGGRFIRLQDAFGKEVDTRLTRDKVDDEDEEETVGIYYDIGSKKAADKAGHAMRLALSKRKDESYMPYIDYV